MDAFCCNIDPGIVSRDTSVVREGTEERLCWECLAAMLPQESVPDKPLDPAARFASQTCVFFFLPHNAPQVRQDDLEGIAERAFGRERLAGCVFVTHRLPQGSDTEIRQAAADRIMFWQGMQANPDRILFDQKLVTTPVLEITMIIGYHADR